MWQTDMHTHITSFKYKYLNCAIIYDFISLCICCVVLPFLGKHTWTHSSCVFRFQNQYGGRVHTALAYAMNSEFGRVLAAQMVWAD